jgi:gamma-glutamylcyclotransferase (GGCT)/AIG2-like uncharacterized protein YtfP
LLQGEPVLYFTYAYNLNKKQMLERCPNSKPGLTVTLPNYKLIFVGWSRQWRGGIASIKPFRGEKVPGSIYEVTEECLRRLDSYEAGYSRLNVIVFDEYNQPHQAIAYAKAGRMEETKPSAEYLAIIQQGYRDWGII